MFIKQKEVEEETSALSQASKSVTKDKNMPKNVVKIAFAKRSILNPDSKSKDIQVNKSKEDPDPAKETRKVTNASGKQFDVPILVTSGYDLDNMRCTLCDKSFKHDRFLMEHLLRHFGIKPKKTTCPVCQKPVNRKSFVRHLRLLHGIENKKISDEKSKKTCPFCSKKVHRNSYLRHLKYFHEENLNKPEIKCNKKKKTCPICAKKVHRKSYLRHLKLCHGLEKKVICLKISNHNDLTKISDKCDNVNELTIGYNPHLRSWITKKPKSTDGENLEKHSNEVSQSVTSSEQSVIIDDEDKTLSRSVTPSKQIVISENEDETLLQSVTPSKQSEISDIEDETLSQSVTPSEQNVMSDDEVETLSQSVTSSEQSVTSESEYETLSQTQPVTLTAQSVTSDDEDVTMSQLVTPFSKEQIVTSGYEDDTMSQSVTPSSEDRMTSDNEDGTLSLRIEDLRSVTWLKDEPMELPNPEVQIPFIKKSNPESNKKEVHKEEFAEFQKCLFCNYMYFNRLDLVRHFVDNHCRTSQFYDDQIQQAKCYQCDMSQTSKLSRLRHLFSTHIDVTYINDELKDFLPTKRDIETCDISQEFHQELNQLSSLPINTFQNILTNPICELCGETVVKKCDHLNMHFKQIFPKEMNCWCMNDHNISTFANYGISYHKGQYHLELFKALEQEFGNEDIDDKSFTRSYFEQTFMEYRKHYFNFTNVSINCELCNHIFPSEIDLRGHKSLVHLSEENCDIITLD